MMLKAFLLLAFIAGISESWNMPRPMPYRCTPTGYPFGGNPHEYRCYLKNDGFNKHFECQGPFNTYPDGPNGDIVIDGNPANPQQN
ncbi:hypothetical protein QR680_006145 [Steinernema hermaphroditum]|uniref:Uncharacterized protein n=1 Tax=Steinernema hermaphroditum TaxID=289476 RepID=A0AA39HWN7_9BILA|nr:hypothetical protein QR680_006145 [Steinernema hermaphroditum]